MDQGSCYHSTEEGTTSEAMLLAKNLSFSKHTGVQAAFGEHFAKTGIVPIEYHRHLIEALAARHEGDYERVLGVGPEVSDIQIKRAAEFIKMVEEKLTTGGATQ